MIQYLYGPSKTVCNTSMGELLYTRNSKLLLKKWNHAQYMTVYSGESPPPPNKHTKFPHLIGHSYWNKSAGCIKRGCYIPIVQCLSSVNSSPTPRFENGCLWCVSKSFKRFYCCWINIFVNLLNSMHANLHAMCIYTRQILQNNLHCIPYDLAILMPLDCLPLVVPQQGHIATNRNHTRLLPLTQDKEAHPMCVGTSQEPKLYLSNKSSE